MENPLPKLKSGVWSHFRLPVTHVMNIKVADKRTKMSAVLRENRLAVTAIFTAPLIAKTGKEKAKGPPIGLDNKAKVSLITGH